MIYRLVYQTGSSPACSVGRTDLWETLLYYQQHFLAAKILIRVPENGIDCKAEPAPLLLTNPVQLLDWLLDKIAKLEN
ncbi:hypothetical protein UY3_13709 [Chelonia mydas]|uniref:Uncharacterized protein n=1 Tax=Chelonia mydas TaxID=8469 RepID=M7B130_CHEMY|nr:hypothetical protein UY3_13709 [Chelonia mydas]